MDSAMKELEKILNIESSDVITSQPLQPAIVPTEEDQPENKDYDYARVNLYSIIEKGKDALDGALRVAEQSEHPRAYEVVGTLLKNLSDVNKQLLTLGKDREEVKAVRKGNIGVNGAATQVTTNNTAVFVGSGADINKLIADRLKVNE